jgi:hypothetical protein
MVLCTASSLALLLAITPQALADVEPVMAPAPVPEAPAEPVAEPAADPVAEPAAEPAPAASPQALRDYRARYLRVESEVREQKGEVWVMSTGHPFWPGWHNSATYVHQQPSQVIRTWGVYQDFMRLNIPAFLTAVGQVEEANALRKEIALLQAKSARRRWIGVAGIVTSVGGAIGLSITANPMASAASGVGLLATAGGFFSAAIPDQKALALRDNYPASFDPGDIRSLVDAHNELLRLDLRLSPTEAMMLESGRRDRSH